MADMLLEFLSNYGLWLTLIAIAGVIILGVLKYCGVFDKFSENIRHLLYLLVSVGISIVGSVIYLACIHELSVALVFAIAAAIFAINQAAYTIYDTTPLRDLLKKLWEKIKGLFTSGEIEDVIEDVKEAIEESTEGTTEEEEVTEEEETEEETVEETTEEE